LSYYRLTVAGILGVCVAACAATALGLARSGIDRSSASLALVAGALAAIFAWRSLGSTSSEKPAAESQSSPKWLTWLVAGIFAAFAFRGFSEALFFKDGRLFANDPYDTPLHISYINYLASGVAFWPADCIYSREPLHYPIGVDLFTGLLVIDGVPIQWCFFALGILASAATAKTLWKWGGTFTVAGFLFNGGLEGFRYLAGKGLEQINYEVDWKSIPIAMFALQRSFLYALPAGLILLISWRKRLLAGEKGLPLWIEWCLYTTMPLFHIHTFIFLSAMLGIWSLTGPNRKETIKLILISIPVATLLVVLVAGFGNAGVIHLKWGWCQGNREFWQYWLGNFGILPILTALLPVWLIATKRGGHPDARITIPSILLFLFFLNVMFALYDWDNTKLLLWCYIGILPAIGEMLLWAKTWMENKYGKTVAGRFLAKCGYATILVLFFFSGSISLWKYIENGPRTWDLASLKELEEIKKATGSIPSEKTYICLHDMANHPLLLTGHKIAAGFGVHIWSHGYKNTLETEKEVDDILNGAADWERCAKDLQADYVFWGKDEKEKYPNSKVPWTRKPIKAQGQDWTLYDLRQTGTPDPELRQQLLALAKKFDEAINNNDAAAVAALYTEDAVLVTDHGSLYGRAAIEKEYADLFQKVHFSNWVTTYDPSSPHPIGGTGDEMWENGEWSVTIQDPNSGPKQRKGFDSSIAVREGSSWKKRLFTWNVSPEAGATPSPGGVIGSH
jgi:ketosteroid isomerase-like protein